MAWTDEAREKAIETRKRNALKQRLAKAKTAFMSDRKRDQAKRQVRNVDTNKFTHFADKDGYNRAAGETRTSKLMKREKAQIDSMKYTATMLSDKGKDAALRDVKGKYTKESDHIAGKIMRDVADLSPHMQKQALMMHASNLVNSSSKQSTVTKQAIAVGTLKVAKAQAVHKLLDAAVSLNTSTAAPRKSKLAPKTFVPPTAKSNPTTAPTYNSKNPFADLEGDL
jgi:hypothetical protein